MTISFSNLYHLLVNLRNADEVGMRFLHTGEILLTHFCDMTLLRLEVLMVSALKPTIFVSQSYFTKRVRLASFTANYENHQSFQRTVKTGRHQTKCCSHIVT